MSHRYAYEKEKICKFNHYLKKYPHLFGHVNVEIHANAELQKHNPQARDLCLYVRLKGSRRFCAKMYCNRHVYRGKTCKANDPLIISKSGDTTVGSCQRACFNLLKPYDPLLTEAATVQLPPTFYDDDCDTCLYMTQEYFNLGIDDYERTNVHPTAHIDTIGTGFNINTKKPYVNKKTFDRTMKFEMNKYYCDNFDYKFDADALSCDLSEGEKVVGLFIGDSIYECLKYVFVHTIYKNDSIYTVQQPKLPTITKEERTRMNYDEEMFYNDDDSGAFAINPNVKLSDLGITDDKMHLYWTTEYGWPGRLQEPLLLWREIAADDIPMQYRYDKTTRRRNRDEFEVLQLHSINYWTMIREQINDPHLFDTTFDVIKAHLKEFAIDSTKMFAATFGYTKVVKPLLKVLVKKAIAPGVAFMTKSMTRILTPKLLQMLMNKIVFDYAAKVTSKLALRFAITFGSSGGMPWLLIIEIIGIIADILLAIVDPLKLGNKMNQDSVDLYSLMDIAMKIKTLDNGTPELSPILLIQMLEQAAEFTSNDSVTIRNKLPTNEENSTTTTTTTTNRLNPPTKYGIKLENVVDIYAGINLLELNLTFAAEYIGMLKYNSNGAKIDYNDHTNETIKKQFFDIHQEAVKISKEYLDVNEIKESVINDLNSLLESSNKSVWHLIYLTVFTLTACPFTIWYNNYEQWTILAVLLCIFIILLLLNYQYYNRKFYIDPEEKNRLIRLINKI